LENELVLLLQGYTARSVTKEQYQQLLFILGQNPTGKNFPFAGPQQTYMEVLKLFNMFGTGTKDNFQDMLYKMQFPFVYNENKPLAKNRHDFKDFFLV
jgi:hypothetical protein